MKEYKIYGESYPLKATTRHPVDSYARGGELVDDPPKGKILGYVEMDDGSIIECHKKTNFVPLLISLIVLVLVIVAILVYLLFFHLEHTLTDLLHLQNLVSLYLLLASLFFSVLRPSLPSD